MPAVTAVKRTQLYLVFACLSFVVALFGVIATALPLWTVEDTYQHGLWGICTDTSDADPWTVSVCVETRSQTKCNGWLQMARVSSLLGIAFAVVCIVLGVACAMQAIITKLLPAITVCIAFLTWFFFMFCWISWLVTRGYNCNNQSGMDLGGSFILEVLGFVIAFFAFILAVYLFIADIFVPAATGY